MNELGIAIDGGRYVRFSPDRDNGAFAVRLQTLGIGADSARLDFVSFHRGGTVLRRSCVVRGLRRRGRPGEIRVHVRRRSRCVWSALIAPAGGVQFEVKIRTGRALWPFVILLLIAVLIPALISAFRFAFQKRLETVPAAAGRMNQAETASAARRLESSASPPPAAAAPETSAQEASVLEAPTLPEAPALPGAPVSGVPAQELPAPEAPASPVTVFFDPDSAFLDAEAIVVLDETLESLPDSPLLRVEGHCAAFGTEEGRIRLSRRRARAVADYLQSRLGENVRIETEGFGVDRPVTEDPLRQNLNRRAEILIETNSL